MHKAAAPLTRISAGILTDILVRITASGACCVETKRIIQSVMKVFIQTRITAGIFLVPTNHITAV